MTLTTAEDRTRMARRLWMAQRELDAAIRELETADESTLNTMGETGEYLLPTASPVLKQCREVACRLDRTVFADVS